MVWLLITEGFPHFQQDENDKLYTSIRELREDIQQLSDKMSDLAAANEHGDSGRELQLLGDTIQQRQSELKNLTEMRFVIIECFSPCVRLSGFQWSFCFLITCSILDDWEVISGCQFNRTLVPQPKLACSHMAGLA